MNYGEEIVKHKKAIKDLYKKQMKARLNSYYVIFARVVDESKSRNNKEYYVNSSSLLESHSLETKEKVDDCLFNKREATDFAKKSKEPEILKASIRKAGEELADNIDSDLLNI